MDIEGILRTLAALLIYPGAGLLILVILPSQFLARHRPRRGDGPTPTWGGVWTGGCALLASCFLPLPGSPIATLPPGGANSAHLIAILLLLLAGASGAGKSAREPFRLVALVAVTLPLAALVAATSSVDLGVVVALSSPWLTAGRLLAGLGLLFSIPALVSGDADPFPRRLLCAAIALLALELMLAQAAWAQSWSGVLLMAMGAAAGCLLLDIQIRRPVRLLIWSLLGLAFGGGAALAVLLPAQL